ncbi:MAG: hypothetical protein MUO68_14330 [Desulfobacteraceae bacterium]|nr:hypothetical protein [Desulfobacteraceae bacterium]
MKKQCLKTVLSVAVGLLLIGCVTPKPKEVSTFNALDLNPMLKGGDYVQKVDNFIVILDKSGSMGELYKGEKKLDYAKDYGVPDESNYSGHQCNRRPEGFRPIGRFQ